MKAITTTVLAALVATSAGAQSYEIEVETTTYELEGSSNVIQLGNDPNVRNETRMKVKNAQMAVMRGLDKLAGASRDIVLKVDEPARYGSLEITMHECRYPNGNPSGDAFMLVTIDDKRTQEGSDSTVFQGWMVASSPALYAMDHPRYDVWAVNCKLEKQTQSAVAGESSPRPVMRP